MFRVKLLIYQGVQYIHYIFIHPNSSTVSQPIRVPGRCWWKVRRQGCLVQSHQGWHSPHRCHTPSRSSFLWLGLRRKKLQLAGLTYHLHINMNQEKCINPGEKWRFIAGKIIDKWENPQKLVGGFSPPLWKMMEFVSWDDEIPNVLWKNKKKTSKPPSRNNVYPLVN